MSTAQGDLVGGDGSLFVKLCLMTSPETDTDLPTCLIYNTASLNSLKTTTPYATPNKQPNSCVYTRGTYSTVLYIETLRPGIRDSNRLTNSAQNSSAIYSRRNKWLKAIFYSFEFRLVTNLNSTEKRELLPL